jgi:hypothetical protein
MKTNSLAAAAALGVALLSPALRAQTASENQPLTPNSVIYLPQVPTVAELSRTAASKNQAIASIQLMNGVETVVYHLPNNQLNVVEYRSLPGTGSSAVTSDAGPAVTSAPMPYVASATTAPAPAVVYTDAPPPAYYYSYPAPYYYPWGWFPAGYIGFGFGGHFGYRGGFGGHFGGFRR